MKGIYVALVSPFDDANRPDKQAQKQLMERHLSEKTDGFFVGGSSAECFLLSEQERMELFESAAVFRDRTDLIAHVGAIGLDETIRYAKFVKSLGYQHIAATPPFYYGFSAAQVRGYYEDLAAAVGMPVMIYNFPVNTNRPFDLSNAETAALFRSDAIFGIKHTNINLSQMERIHNLNPRLVLMNGYDETMVAGLALGAHGSIGSTFNVMLPHYRKIYDAYLAGKREEALEMQYKANNLMEALCNVGLIPAIKYVLEQQGNPCGLPRKPFTPPTQAQKDYLDKMFAENLIQ